MSGSETRFPWFSFVTVGLLTLFTIGVQVDGSLDYLATIEGLEENEIATERICGEITHLDEVLTMSARMAAATGEPHWEERYLEHLPRLDSALAAARELAPGAEALEGSQQVDQANLRLVEMEIEAFALVGEGRLEEASALLTCREYESCKALYAVGNKRYLANMRARVSDLLQTAKLRARQTKIVVLGLLPLIGLMWFRVGTLIRTHVGYRRQTERSLREHANELERKNEEVREAVRVKGEFLARMSHEIRTPMNGVLGIAEVLAKTPLSEEQARYVGTILGSGSLLESILSDILDFSKIEAGMMRIVPVPTSPRELVREVVLTFSETARAKGIELRSHVDEGVPERLLIDPVRVRQIFLNLVGNAIKFTAEGHVELRLEPVAGKQAILGRVEDTGIGIPEERLAGVFEGFVQADDSVSREYGGTGLGLTICRELTRAMGGTIRADSRPGAGTEFTVELPAVPAGIPAALPAAGPATSRAGEPAEVRGRVLVAEDNAVNKLVAQRLLEGMGCDVVVVDNGRECVEEYRRRGADLILMDLAMPVLDGLGAAREIRRLEDGGEGIPIVAFTASAMAEIGEQCREAGMNAMLSKPIRRAELLETLEQFLGNRPAEEQRGSRDFAPQADFHSAG